MKNIKHTAGIVFITILCSCASNQTMEELNNKENSFLQGGEPKTGAGSATSVRTDPDDLRYQLTISDGQFYDPVFTGRVLSYMNRFTYHKPEENWLQMHKVIEEALGTLDKQLPIEAALTNTESIVFVFLDKYVNKVPISVKSAEVTRFYLEKLQKLNSKAELGVVIFAYSRIKKYLTPPEVQFMDDYYDFLAESVIDDPKSLPLAQEWAKNAKQLLHNNK